MLIAPILTDEEFTKTLSHALRSQYLDYLDYAFEPGMEPLAEWGKQMKEMADIMTEYLEAKNLPTMISEITS